MLIGSPASDDEGERSAHALAVAADARAGARLGYAIDDLMLRDDARLSDRTRAAVHAALAGIVASAEANVRSHAARLLSARGEATEAEALRDGRPLLPRLTQAGLLRDRDLMEELFARVELDLLADTPAQAGPRPDGPSLLARLAGSPDGVVATAAAALLAAEARRRSGLDGSGPVRSELRADLHGKLMWWVAAGVREQSGTSDGMVERDRALAEATRRGLSAHDENDRPEIAAERLASAIDASADELAPLLLEAVGDRRLTLFSALAARAAGVDYEQVRALVVDPRSDLLLLLLHGVGLDRTTITQIGVALAETDPGRDLEGVADAVDWAVQHDRESARAALAPLALNRDFRTAVRALSRAG